MDEELAVLCNVQSELELAALRGMLDEAEIPYIVRGARVPGYSGVFEVYAGHYAAVLVHATDYYRAWRRVDDWRDMLAAAAAEAAPREPLSTEERIARHRTRLNHIAGDALTALVMLLALPVLLVNELLHGWQARSTAAAKPAAAKRDELDTAPR